MSAIVLFDNVIYSDTVAIADDGYWIYGEYQALDRVNGFMYKQRTLLEIYRFLNKHVKPWRSFELIKLEGYV